MPDKPGPGGDQQGHKGLKGALPFRLPVKQLLLVLGVAATLYAAALLVWGESPRACGRWPSPCWCGY